jgi:hypothetical protein
MTTPVIPASTLPAVPSLQRSHVVTLLRQLGSHAIGGVVAVQGTGGWATNAELMVDGVRWRATRAGSELAIRELLAEHEQAGA